MERPIFSCKPTPPEEIVMPTPPVLLTKNILISLDKIAFPYIGATASRVWSMLVTWQTRASQRAHLSELPDHLLRDMAMTRAEANAEAGKPFWKA